MPATLGEGNQGPGLLLAMQRYWWLVAATVIGAVLLGLGLSWLQPTRYTAAAQVLLTDVRAPSVFGSAIGGDAERRLLTEARRMESGPVRARAAQLLHDTLSPGQIGERVDVQASTTIDLLRVEAVGATGEEAAAIANAMTEAYRQVASEGRQARAQEAAAQLEDYRAQLQLRVDQLDAQLGEIRAQTEAAVAADAGPIPIPRQSQIDATQRRLAANRDYQDLLAERNSAFQQLLSIANRAGEVGVEAAATGAGISTIEPAGAPTIPSSPKTRRDAAIAGALGVLVGCMLAWWRADRGRPSIGREAASLFDVPRLGAVPHSEALAGRWPGAVHDPAAGDAFQLAAASLSLAVARRRLHSVLVTSARRGTGTTTVALNLAHAAAKGGRSVALVDGDTRTQGLTRSAGVDGAPGLPELSSSAHSVDAVLVPLGPEGTSLRLVPAGGSPNDPTVFATAMRRIERECELVVVDAPPLPSSADALEMAAAIGGVVLVITPETTAAEFQDLLGRVHFTNAPLLGFVVNDVRRPRWWQRAAAGRSETTVAIDLEGRDADASVTAPPLSVR